MQAAQQRCSKCNGSGLVKLSGSYFRCGKCGTFLSLHAFYNREEPLILCTYWCVIGVLPNISVRSNIQHQKRNLLDYHKNETWMCFFWEIKIHCWLATHGIRPLICLFLRIMNIYTMMHSYYAHVIWGPGIWSSFDFGSKWHEPHCDFLSAILWTCTY